MKQCRVCTGGVKWSPVRVKLCGVKFRQGIVTYSEGDVSSGKALSCNGNVKRSEVQWRNGGVGFGVVAVR